MNRPIAVLSLVAGGAATATDIVQFVAVLVGLAVALAVGRVKRKDAIIADLEKSEERLTKALSGASERADREHEQVRECEKRIAAYQAEISTMERYTAQGALETVARELGAVRETIVSAIQDQGQLVLEGLASSAGQTKVLEAIAKGQEKLVEDLGLLAERLGAMGDRPPGAAADHPPP